MKYTVASYNVSTYDVTIRTRCETAKDAALALAEWLAETRDGQINSQFVDVICDLNSSIFVRCNHSYTTPLMDDVVYWIEQTV